jgi:integrase
MALRLHTREARRKLVPRDAPYYIELRRGLAIGYRRGGQSGSWLVREFKADVTHKMGGRYLKRRLGVADDELPADGKTVLSWEDATKLALGEERPTVTQPGRLTLAEAAQAYFDTRTARTPHDRFTWTKFISTTKLASKSVSEIKTGDLEQWLALQVPQTDDPEKRRAAQATANRRWTVLRAILNSAFRKDPARVPSDGAWRRVKPFPKVDRPRTRTLTADECKRLLVKLDKPFAALVRGSLYTGLRLGELERLKADDIGENVVCVRISKSGQPRTVALNAEGATFFADLAKGKEPELPVFERITRMDVSRQMRAGCQAAEIYPPAVFHDLRRTYGSLLLNARVSADVIQDLLGHADQRMTRRTYAHLALATMHKAVRKLPSFGGAAPKKRARRKATHATRP